MADHYELEAKSGRIWLKTAKDQIDQSTRIVSKENTKEGSQFHGEQIVLNFYFYFTASFEFVSFLVNNLLDINTRKFI